MIRRDWVDLIKAKARQRRAKAKAVAPPAELEDELTKVRALAPPPLASNANSNFHFAKPNLVNSARELLSAWCRQNCHGVNPMMDNDTQLMVSIFRRVFQSVGSEEHVPDRYMKSFKSEIEEAGQLFAYLGLAKPDTQSPLGWRPTPALMDVVAKRAVRRSKPIDRAVRAEESLIISLLLDAAFGEDREVYPLFAFSVLTALGFTRETITDDDLPTPHLRRLFAKAYNDRQAKEAKPKQLAIGVPKRN